MQLLIAKLHSCCVKESGSNFGKVGMKNFGKVRHFIFKSTTLVPFLYLNLAYSVLGAKIDMSISKNI